MESDRANTSVDDLYGDLDEMFAGQSDGDTGQFSEDSNPASFSSGRTLTSKDGTDIEAAMDDSEGHLDDLDLYDDLIREEDQNRLNSYQEMVKKYEEAVSQMSKMEAEIRALREANTKHETTSRDLQKNFTSLLITAKGELSRKEREIASLRKKTANQRRSPRKGRFSEAAYTDTTSFTSVDSDFEPLCVSSPGTSITSRFNRFPTNRREMDKEKRASVVVSARKDSVNKSDSVSERRESSDNRIRSDSKSSSKSSVKTNDKHVEMKTDRHRHLSDSDSDVTSRKRPGRDKSERSANDKTDKRQDRSNSSQDSRQDRHKSCDRRKREKSRCRDSESSSIKLTSLDKPTDSWASVKTKQKECDSDSQKEQSRQKSIVKTPNNDKVITDKLKIQSLDLSEIDRRTRLKDMDEKIKRTTDVKVGDLREKLKLKRQKTVTDKTDQSSDLLNKTGGEATPLTSNFSEKESRKSPVDILSVKESSCRDKAVCNSTTELGTRKPKLNKLRENLEEEKAFLENLKNSIKTKESTQCSNQVSVNVEAGKDKLHKNVKQSLGSRTVVSYSDVNCEDIDLETNVNQETAVFSTSEVSEHMSSFDTPVPSDTDMTEVTASFSGEDVTKDNVETVCHESALVKNKKYLDAQNNTVEDKLNEEVNGENIEGQKSNLEKKSVVLGHRNKEDVDVNNVMYIKSNVTEVDKAERIVSDTKKDNIQISLNGKVSVLNNTVVNTGMKTGQKNSKTPSPDTEDNRSSYRLRSKNSSEENSAEKVHKLNESVSGEENATPVTARRRSARLMSKSESSSTTPEGRVKSVEKASDNEHSLKKKSDSSDIDAEASAKKVYLRRQSSEKKKKKKVRRCVISETVSSVTSVDMSRSVSDMFQTIDNNTEEEDVNTESTEGIDLPDDTRKSFSSQKIRNSICSDVNCKIKMKHLHPKTSPTAAESSAVEKKIITGNDKEDEIRAEISCNSAIAAGNSVHSDISNSNFDKNSEVGQQSVRDQSPLGILSVCHQGSATAELNEVIKESDLLREKYDTAPRDTMIETLKITAKSNSLEVSSEVLMQSDIAVATCTTHYGTSVSRVMKQDDAAAGKSQSNVSVARITTQNDGPVIHDAEESNEPKKQDTTQSDTVAAGPITCRGTIEDRPQVDSRHDTTYRNTDEESDSESGSSSSSYFSDEESFTHPSSCSTCSSSSDVSDSDSEVSLSDSEKRHHLLQAKINLINEKLLSDSVKRSRSEGFLVTDGFAVKAKVNQSGLNSSSKPVSLENEVRSTLASLCDKVVSNHAQSVVDSMPENVVEVRKMDHLEKSSDYEYSQNFLQTAERIKPTVSFGIQEAMTEDSQKDEKMETFTQESPVQETHQENEFTEIIGNQKIKSKAAEQLAVGEKQQKESKSFCKNGRTTLDRQTIFETVKNLPVNSPEKTDRKSTSGNFTESEDMAQSGHESFETDSEKSYSEDESYSCSGSGSWSSYSSGSSFTPGSSGSETEDTEDSNRKPDVTVQGAAENNRKTAVGGNLKGGKLQEMKEQATNHIKDLLTETCRSEKDTVWCKNYVGAKSEITPDENMDKTPSNVTAAEVDSCGVVDCQNVETDGIDEKEDERGEPCYLKVASSTANASSSSRNADSIERSQGRTVKPDAVHSPDRSHLLQCLVKCVQKEVEQEQRLKILGNATTEERENKYKTAVDSAETTVSTQRKPESTSKVTPEIPTCSLTSVQDSEADTVVQSSTVPEKVVGSEKAGERDIHEELFGSTLSLSSGYSDSESKDAVQSAVGSNEMSGSISESESDKKNGNNRNWCHTLQKKRKSSETANSNFKDADADVRFDKEKLVIEQERDVIDVNGKSGRQVSLPLASSATKSSARLAGSDSGQMTSAKQLQNTKDSTTTTAKPVQKPFKSVLVEQKDEEQIDKKKHSDVCDTESYETLSSKDSSEKFQKTEKKNKQNVSATKCTMESEVCTSCVQSRVKSRFVIEDEEPNFLSDLKSSQVSETSESKRTTSVKSKTKTKSNDKKSVGKLDAFVADDHISKTKGEKAASGRKRSSHDNVLKVVIKGKRLKSETDQVTRKSPRSKFSDFTMGKTKGENKASPENKCSSGEKVSMRKVPPELETDKNESQIHADSETESRKGGRNEKSYMKKHKVNGKSKSESVAIKSHQKLVKDKKHAKTEQHPSKLDDKARNQGLVDKKENFAQGKVSLFKKGQFHDTTKELSEKIMKLKVEQNLLISKLEEKEKTKHDPIKLKLPVPKKKDSKENLFTSTSKGPITSKTEPLQHVKDANAPVQTLDKVDSLKHNLDKEFDAREKVNVQKLKGSEFALSVNTAGLKTFTIPKTSALTKLDQSKTSQTKGNTSVLAKMYKSTKASRERETYNKKKVSSSRKKISSPKKLVSPKDKPLKHPLRRSDGGYTDSDSVSRSSSDEDEDSDAIVKAIFGESSDSSGNSKLSLTLADLRKTRSNEDNNLTHKKTIERKSKDTCLLSRAKDKSSGSKKNIESVGSMVGDAESLKLSCQAKKDTAVRRSEDLDRDLKNGEPDSVVSPRKSPRIQKMELNRNEDKLAKVSKQTSKRSPKTDKGVRHFAVEGGTLVSPKKTGEKVQDKKRSGQKENQASANSGLSQNKSATGKGIPELLLEENTMDRIDYHDELVLDEHNLNEYDNESSENEEGSAQEILSGPEEDSCKDGEAGSGESFSARSDGSVEEGELSDAETHSEKSGYACKGKMWSELLTGKTSKGAEQLSSDARRKSHISPIKFPSSTDNKSTPEKEVSCRCANRNCVHKKYFDSLGSDHRRKRKRSRSDSDTGKEITYSPCSRKRVRNDRPSDRRRSRSPRYDSSRQNRQELRRLPPKLDKRKVISPRRPRSVSRSPRMSKQKSRSRSLDRSKRRRKSSSRSPLKPDRKNRVIQRGHGKDYSDYSETDSPRVDGRRRSRDKLKTARYSGGRRHSDRESPRRSSDRKAIRRSDSEAGRCSMKTSYQMHKENQRRKVDSGRDRRAQDSRDRDSVIGEESSDNERSKMLKASRHGDTNKEFRRSVKDSGSQRRRRVNQYSSSVEKKRKDKRHRSSSDSDDEIRSLKKSLGSCADSSHKRSRKEEESDRSFST